MTNPQNSVDAPESPLMVPSSKRLVSLDAFRGLTIAFMILVNNPGSWGAIYPPLAHADWHGCSPTDLVFPFFLFIVGVSIPLSQSARLRKPGATRKQLVFSIPRRAALIILIGVALAAIPTSRTGGFFSPGTLRIPGVLQRIGVCYGIAALLTLFLSWRSLLAVVVTLLAIYSALMLGLSAPGFPRGDLSAAGSFASHIDRIVLGAHKWKKDYDPEGILSTLPAITTTIFGIFAGIWLGTARPNMEKCAGILAAGVVGTGLGYALDGALMPINKALWTTSYAVYTAGLALLTLGLFFWIIDVHRYDKWSKPLAIFGMNAIAMFVLSALFSKLFAAIKWTAEDGKTVALRSWYYDHIFLKVAGGKVASLTHAIVWVLGLYLIALVMYRKKLFLKV